MIRAFSLTILIPLFARTALAAPTYIVTGEIACLKILQNIRPENSRDREATLQMMDEFLVKLSDKNAVALEDSGRDEKGSLAYSTATLAHEKNRQGPAGYLSPAITRAKRPLVLNRNSNSEAVGYQLISLADKVKSGEAHVFHLQGHDSVRRYLEALKSDLPSILSDTKYMEAAAPLRETIPPLSIYSLNFGVEATFLGLLGASYLFTRLHPGVHPTNLQAGALAVTGVTFGVLAALAKYQLSVWPRHTKYWLKPDPASQFYPRITQMLGEDPALFPREGILSSAPGIPRAKPTRIAGDFVYWSFIDQDVEVNLIFRRGNEARQSELSVAVRPVVGNSIAAVANKKYHTLAEQYPLKPSLKDRMKVWLGRLGFNRKPSEPRSLPPVSRWPIEEYPAENAPRDPQLFEQDLEEIMAGLQQGANP